MRLNKCRLIASGIVIAIASAPTSGCSNDRPPPPARTADSADRVARQPEVETPAAIENATAYRAKLTHGAELYLPPWFSPKKGGYDLIVHFHGLGKLQEANIERVHLNVAVVSVNLGVGTDPYANAFRDPASFQRLLSESEEEVEKSGRSHGAQRRRLALTAWSAGFVSVSKVMNDPQMVDRVDAVLLADGFFTSYTGDKKKKTINVAPLEKFIHLAGEAGENKKLFAITHTSIPTVDYPSVTDVVAKLLELTSTSKVPSSVIGPRNMHEIYEADRGSFHVKGYEGVRAGDHVKQIQVMGETLYPYLKARWESAEGTDAPAPQAAVAPATPSAVAR